MVQLEKDAEVVCWITVSVAAGSIIALTAGLLWTIQQRKVTFLDWPRFQQLAFCSYITGIIMDIAAIAEIVLVMENSPDRLATHAIVEPFVSDQGTPLILISVADLVGHIALPATVLLYFLILMERMSAFRFLQPGRFFQILHVTLSVLGVVLFLKMELANILVNVIQDPRSSTFLLVTIISNALSFILCTIIEWTLSMALCRKYLFKSPTTWSLHQRRAYHNFSYTEFELQSTNNEALKNASPSRLSDNSGTVQSPPFGHFVPDHRQRTILLFFAFLFTDLTGLFLYGLSFLPITTNVKRPLQLIGRSAVGLHIVTALLFLDSFRTILHRSNPSSSENTNPSFIR